MFEGVKETFAATKSNRTPNRGLKITNIIHVFYRFIQIIMACVVIGYYASDLNAARKVQKYSDSKWVRLVVSKLSRHCNTDYVLGLCCCRRGSVSCHCPSLYCSRYYIRIPYCRHVVWVGVDSGHTVVCLLRYLWSHVQDRKS